MTPEYEKLATSVAVFKAVMLEHREELHCFASYSAPTGDRFGNPSRAVMMTEWGFQEAAIPTFGVETTWDVDPHNPLDRPNLQEHYWLCLPQECEE